MGNKFESQAQIFGQSERYTIVMPNEMLRLITDAFKTPYAIFEFFRGIFKEPFFMYTYSVNQTQFVKLIQTYVNLEIETSDIESIFRIFAVSPMQAMGGPNAKVVNILEFISAIILMADFGDTSNDDLQYNAELIEHKINLMLLLFDLRNTNKMNISEVIIMLKTSLQALSKLFPTVSFFRNHSVLDEIKETTVALFKETLEQGVAEMYGNRNNAASQGSEKKLEQKIAKAEIKRERMGSNFLGFKQTNSQGGVGSLGAGSLQNMGHLGGQTQTADPENKESQMYTMYQPQGYSALQKHIGESVEEKKRRLFKWNDFEKIMIPVDQIKEQLVTCNNVIKFLSLFNSFNMVTLVWGSNRSLNQGLHIQKNFQGYYDLESGRQLVGQTSDRAVRDLVNLSKKQAKDNDDLLVFQVLLQKWQDALSVQRQNTQDFLKTMMKQKTQYERVKQYDRPTLMMSLLNTHCAQIEANNRMAVTRTPEGQCFSLGKDFRNQKNEQDERQFGIPRLLHLKEGVVQLALGKDHCLMLTEQQNLFAFGSNEFGQLGIDQKQQNVDRPKYESNTSLFEEGSGGSITPKVTSNRLNNQSGFKEFSASVAGGAGGTNGENSQNRNVSSAVEGDGTQRVLLQEFEHPITYTVVQYSSDPVRIPFNVEDQIKQIQAGDYHNVFLTQKGDLFSWGLASSGQLGINRNGGVICDLMSQNGIQYSPHPLLIETLDGKKIRKVIAKHNMNFAFSDKGKVYNWGYFPNGMSLKSHEESLDIPTKNVEMAGYQFMDLALSKETAVGIGNSISLVFEFTDDDSEEETNKKGGLTGSTSAKNVMLDLEKAMRKKLTRAIQGEQVKHSVVLNAVPVIDGTLFKSMGEIQEFLHESENMTVELINDFDLPWVQRKTTFYPKYRRIHKRRIIDGQDIMDDGDDDGSGDEMQLVTDDEEEEEEDSLDEEENKSQNEEEGAEDDGPISDEEPAAAKKKPSKKRQSKQQRLKRQQELQVQQRERETSQFIQRLPNKPYLRKFANLAESGIAEMNARDEETCTQDGDASEKGANKEGQDVQTMSYKRKSIGADGDADEKGSNLNSGATNDDNSDDSVSNEDDDGENSDDAQDDYSPGEVGEGDQDMDGDDLDSDEDSASEQAALMEAKAAANEEGLTAKALDFLKVEFRNQRGIFVDKQQLESEKSYMQPSEPEIRTKGKVNRMPLKQKLSEGQVLVVNFLGGDYQFFLKKVLNVVFALSENLRMIICPIPLHANKLDLYYAKRIQRAAANFSRQVVIAFVPYKSHVALLQNFYKVGTKNVKKISQNVQLTANVDEGTLLYSWGSATFGKLGIEANLARECEEHSEIIRRDMTFFDEDARQINNSFFAHHPQPVITFLGSKMRTVAAGLHHFLALTSAGDLYAWGDNSCNQLGLDPEKLQMANGSMRNQTGHQSLSKLMDKQILSQSSPSNSGTSQHSAGASGLSSHGQSAGQSHRSSATESKASLSMQSAMSHQNQQGADGGYVDDEIGLLKIADKSADKFQNAMIEGDTNTNQQTNDLVAGMSSGAANVAGGNTGPISPKASLNKRNENNSTPLSQQFQTKKYVKLAKVPYKVPMDKQQEVGISSNLISAIKSNAPSAGNSRLSKLQVQRIQQAMTQNSGPVQVKEQRFEMISCGDYNSYAIINI